MPMGRVMFYDGSSRLGVSTLSGGTATYTSSAFGVGPHAISAVYAGDANYTAGMSAVLNLVVQKGPQAVTVTPAVTRIPAFQSLSVVVNVTGSAGNPAPSGSVTLLADASNRFRTAKCLAP
jgi:hypothetical protein